MGKHKVNEVQSPTNSGNPFDDQSITSIANEKPYFNELSDAEIEINEEVKPKVENVKLDPKSQKSPLSSTKERNNIDMRAKYLSQREEELLYREQILENRERELRDSLTEEPRINNWPFKVIAIDFHDIESEIPAHNQRICKMAYHLFFYTVFGLLWNLLCLILEMELTQNIAENAVVKFLYGIIYLITGTMGAWAGWYKNLYNALQTSHKRFYIVFAIVFGMHFLFIVYILAGFPSMNSAGIVTVLAQFAKGGSWIVFAFSLVNCILWGINLLLSIWVLNRVYRAYNQKGENDKSLDELRDETRRSVLVKIAERL